MSQQLNPQQLQKKWKIGESVLDVLISGKSFLDTRDGFRGSFPNKEVTERFLLGYGYDLQDPIEKAEIHGTLQEAIRFIKTHFLKPSNSDGLSLDIPKKITEIYDIHDLLMYAASETQTELRHWACAILRVMHTICHVDRDVRTHYFSDIQTQILDRFYRQLHRDEHGQLYLGRGPADPLRVDLVEFQVKPKKARDSTLMKLLHKAESVAEELFDRVGVRFITKTRSDAVRVVRFLEYMDIVVAVNIKPSRSRNTLIDTQAFRETLSREFPKVESGELSEHLFETILEKIPGPMGRAHDNRHSSEFYRAMQFTCRQLIKIRNPLSDHIRDLKKITREMPMDPLLAAAIEKVDQKYIQRVTRFFYPFEVQLMDHASYLENEKGRSAHVEYKKAQRKAAMIRVMGALAPNESSG